jgi:hypothetical protein
MWWLPQINGTHIWESRWFESMYTLQEKTWSIRYTLFTLHPHRVPAHTSHVVHVSNLSLVHTRSKQAPTPERNLGNQKQTGSAVVLGCLILPPTRQPWSRGENVRRSGYTATSTYWAHIPAYDQYVQYLLAGANPSILNRYRWGLQP